MVSDTCFFGVYIEGKVIDFSWSNQISATGLTANSKNNQNGALTTGPRRMGLAGSTDP